LSPLFSRKSQEFQVMQMGLPPRIFLAHRKEFVA